jgi:hypothetical protein
MTTRKRILRAAVAGAAALSIAGGAVAVTNSAFAAENAPQMMCPPDISYRSYTIGSPWYVAAGDVVSKYNSSQSTATLSMSESTSSTHTTSWNIQGKITLEFAISKVEVGLGYTVTDSVTKGTTFTDTMTVDSHHYGHMQPKVKYQRFGVDTQRDNGNCKGVTVTDTAVFDGIIIPKVYSECQATNDECTTKP